MSETREHQLKWPARATQTYDRVEKESYPEVIVEFGEDEKYIAQPNGEDGEEYWLLGKLVDEPYEKWTEDGLRQFVEIRGINGSQAENIEDLLEGTDRNNYTQASIVARSKNYISEELPDDSEE